MTTHGGTVALVVGSISRDLEERDEGILEAPGGVVHYAGIALAQLGAAVRVVTRLRSEDRHLLAPLRAQGAKVRALPSRETTTYRNDYRGALDRHELLATSDPIGPDDVPRGWRGADLVQLGPLHRGDVEAGLAEELGGIVGLDLQGLLRCVRGGRTVLAPNPDLPLFLVHVQVVHASESELPAALDGESLDRFVRRRKIPEMLVTLGARGALLLEGGRRREIPSHRPASHHRAGAGDVFLASYLWLRARGRSPLEAARGAVVASGAHVQKGEIPKGLLQGDEA